jgi:hypothetical protein
MAPCSRRASGARESSAPGVHAWAARAKACGTAPEHRMQRACMPPSMAQGRLEVQQLACMPQPSKPPVEEPSAKCRMQAAPGCRPQRRAGARSRGAPGAACGPPGCGPCGQSSRRARRRRAARLVWPGAPGACGSVLPPHAPPRRSPSSAHACAEGSASAHAFAEGVAPQCLLHPTTSNLPRIPFQCPTHSKAA